MIGGKNITLLMDSHLEGKFSTEEATLVFELASQCLQYEPRDRPSIKELVAALVPLQNKSDVSASFFLIPSIKSLLLSASSSSGMSFNRFTYLGVDLNSSSKCVDANLNSVDPDSCLFWRFYVFFSLVQALC